MARPTKLTPEVAARIGVAIKLGVTHRAAAAYGLVDYSTFRRWMVRGENEARGHYHEFAAYIDQCEGAAVVFLMSLMQSASERGDWRATAWLLEHRWPEEYGPARLRVEYAGDLRVNVTDETDLLADVREAIRVVFPEDPDAPKRFMTLWKHARAEQEQPVPTPIWSHRRRGA